MRLPENPEDMSLEEAAEFCLSIWSAECAYSSIRTYRRDIASFLAWADENDITLEELEDWDITRYETYAHNNPEWSPSTVRNKLKHLKKFITEIGDRGLLNDYITVSVPNLDDEDEVNLDKWHKTNALPQIRFFRDSPQHRGKRYTTVSEVEWFTAARQKGIKSLDLVDYVRDPPEDHPAEGPYLRFKHRPDTGTPLKNDEASERFVEISEEVADTLDYYIEHFRIDIRDEYGREPLFTTQQGRISRTTIREDTYLATLPCHRIECPHDKDPAECEWAEFRSASKCPSSKSSHRLRTGSIQWQLDEGIPVEDVADRVDATPETIRKYYDVPEEAEKMENRRRQYTSVLEDSIEDADDGEQDQG